MSTTDLLSKIASLPAPLRVELEHYLEFLLEKTHSAPVKDYAIGEHTSNVLEVREPYISYAEEPDVTALAGIWKDDHRTLHDIREKAWGKRK